MAKRDEELSIEDLVNCEIQQRPYSTFKEDKDNQLSRYTASALYALKIKAELFGETINPDSITFYEMRIPVKKLLRKSFNKVIWTTPDSLGLPVHFRLSEDPDYELLNGIPVISDDTNMRLYEFLEYCKQNKVEVKNPVYHPTLKEKFGDLLDIIFGLNLRLSRA